MLSTDDSNFILGNYKLIEVLGMGAMGYVYRARQLNLERDVAVKILSPKLAQETGHLDLFFREARTAASLEHPHIVPIFDYGVQQNVSYVAMRLLLGGTLDERIQYRLKRSLPLPSLPEIITILTQAASALDYAHARGVIHRDIKPTNLMFDSHGVMYIVDFGIAKLVGTTSSMKGGTFLGTPSFMAPEQWAGLEPTPAVDQYALGAVIYMMITGHAPFESDTALALMNKHMKETPKDVQVYRPNIPTQINTVLQKALAKEPDERFPNTRAFAQAFAVAVHDTADEKPTEFMTYALPQTFFSLPFPTPTRPPAIPSDAENAPDGSKTIHISFLQGRNLLLSIESALLLLAIGVIAFLVIQRISTVPPTSAAGFAAAQMASATPADDGTPSSTNEGNIAVLLLPLTSTQTQTFTATSIPTTTNTASATYTANSPIPITTTTFTPMRTPSPIPSATATATRTFTPTRTPSPTPTLTETATATPTETATPSPTATNAVARPRPTVHWRSGSDLNINNPSGAWLRSRPSTGASQVATLAYHNPVKATGRNYFDGRQWWWEVRASWGAVGWIEQYSLKES